MTNAFNVMVDRNVIVCSHVIIPILPLRLVLSRQRVLTMKMNSKCVSDADRSARARLSALGSVLKCVSDQVWYSDLFVVF